MSTYTIGEIAGWLALTAVLGFALGWLTRELVLRGRGTTGRTEVPVEQSSARTEPAVPAVPAAPAAPVIVPGPHPGSALPLPDGSAPSPDHVVKVSRSSRIYHAPSSPAWARTTAAFWFTSTADAEAAGFRKPKNG